MWRASKIEAKSTLPPCLQLGKGMAHLSIARTRTTRGGGKVETGSRASRLLVCRQTDYE